MARTGWTAAPQRAALALRVAWGAALGLALATAQVQAQTQAQPTPATPYTLPPAPAAGSGLGMAQAVVVQRVRFDGLRSLPAAALQPVVEPFLGRPLRALELEDLRQQVTRQLVERGYVASGALLPEQLDADGTLALRIVEGELTRISVSGLGRLDADYLRARLTRGGETLDTQRLQERYQLLLTDPLFTRLNARLLPGDAPGRAWLDIDAERARPWQLDLFANNYRAPAVGSTVAGLSGSLRNLSGWGDTLDATLYHAGERTSHDASWTLPLAAQRTLATLRVARAHASVVEEPVSALDLDSLIDSREIGLVQPLVDDTRQRWTVGLSHLRKYNATTLLGLPFSLVDGEASGTTRLEAWRLQQDLTLRLERHVAALRAVWQQGRSNIDPALASDQAPARRYRLWQLQGQLSLGLPRDDSQLLLRGQLQRSPDRLLPMEQVALGGRHTVRGYRENTLVRDNAWSLSAELHWPLWRDDSRRGRLALVPFVDAGEAWNRGDARQRLASAGLGLMLAVASFDAELFVAHRLHRRPADTRGDLQDHGIHIALRYRPF